MALNMNDFSGLKQHINGPVAAAVGAAFATGLLSAFLLTGPDAASTPGVQAAATPETCLTQAWPYRDQACRDSERAERKMREVRIVSTDKSQPSRIVQSAVSEPAVQRKTETAHTAAAATAPAPAAKREYAASWLMGVERLPDFATRTPPVISLSAASAALPVTGTPASTQTADIQTAPEAPAAAIPEPARKTASAPSAPAPAEDKLEQAAAEVAAMPPAQPAKRVRTARKPEPRELNAEPSGAARTLIRTYEFADGRTVTVRHRLRAGEDRPDIEGDGVLSYASSRNVQVMRDID